MPEAPEKILELNTLQIKKLASLDKKRKRKEFDLCRNNVEYFIKKYFRVFPKKGGKPIKWRFKKPQQDALDMILEKYHKPYKKTKKGKIIYRLQGVRFLAVKYRQVGFSTLIQALMIHDTIFFENTVSYIFLHLAEYSKRMLEKLKKLFNTLPAFLKPKQYRKDRDSATTLQWSSIGSGFYIGTPGKTEEQSGDKLRSDTANNCLVSELPRYPHAKAFLGAISAALKFGNIYIESTPLVLGDLFHTLYEQGKKGLNEWSVMFVPWVYEAEYVAEGPVPPEKAEQIMSALTDSEQTLLETYGPELITPERILFRRYTIASDFAGDERKFLQDYPEDDKSCFMGSGHGVFTSKETEIKRLTCEFRDARPGAFHIIGGDCARGLGGNHDSNSLQVIDFFTGEQVYTWDSNTTSDKEFPHKIYEVWQKYPGVVAIEANDVGEGVLAILRNAAEFKDDVIFQSMLYRKSKTQDGWRTDANKERVISELYQGLLEGAKGYDEEPELKYPTEEEMIRLLAMIPDGIRLACQDTVDQLGWFVNLGGRKMGAPEGTGLHDDRVMALAICWQMRKLALSYYEYYLDLKKDYAHA